MEDFPKGYFDPLPILIPEVIDVADEPEPELTEKEKEIQQKREKAQRCKVIALSSMGLHPITNVSALQNKTKLKVIELVKELFEKDDEEIIKEFHAVVINDVLSEEKDYTSYPIYKRTIKV
jgi:uncharacterized radical SAM superfamily Fe-S cluster-containing enzyme